MYIIHLYSTDFFVFWEWYIFFQAEFDTQCQESLAGTPPVNSRMYSWTQISLLPSPPYGRAWMAWGYGLLVISYWKWRFDRPPVWPWVARAKLVTTDKRSRLQRRASVFSQFTFFRLDKRLKPFTAVCKTLGRAPLFVRTCVFGPNTCFSCTPRLQ
jgi:hypothetical protein